MKTITYGNGKLNRLTSLTPNRRLLLACILCFLNSESFSQDTEEPQVVEWRMSTEEVDTSQSDATVEVEFRITDNDSGTKTPALIARSSTTTQSSAGFAAVSLVSGDRTDGVWKAAVTIPKGSASGVWEVLLYPLEDNQGNSGAFGPPSTFDNEFTVAHSSTDLDADSDNDGYTDRHELEMGSDPLDS